MNTILFFDDWLLREHQGLDRLQGHPSVLADITPTLPPALSMARGTELFLEASSGRYAMYVDCMPVDPKLPRFNVRFESDDPTDWPETRGVRAESALSLSAPNLVVDQDGEPLSSYTVASLAGTPLADRRWVMTLYSYRVEAPGHANVGFSQDGVHFDVDTSKVWIPNLSDTWNGAVYDPWGQCFRIFGRPNGTDRRVARVVTKDFETFSEPQVVLQPDAEDPPCREFYGMTNVRYEDLFVGSLSSYDADPGEPGRVTWQGTNQMELSYSYDGDHWYRAFREPFIARGSPGTPSGGSVYAGPAVRTLDNRLLFLAITCWGDHYTDEESDEWKRGFYRTLLYEMRLDGFAYLRTRARSGFIRTKTLIPQGDALSLNVRTTRSGCVRVQVLDGETLEPVPGYTLADAVPITGDELVAKVRWREREGIGELVGRPVCVEVHVREGELYALRLSFKPFYAAFPVDRI